MKSDYENKGFWHFIKLASEREREGEGREGETDMHFTVWYAHFKRIPMKPL